MKRIVLFFVACGLALCFSLSAAAASFDFRLPNGFFIPEETASEKACSLVCRDVGCVGGFRITDLEPMALADYSCTSIAEYLQKELPEGYGLDYIMDFGRTVTASAIWVNLSTMEIREYKHRFFEKNGAVYDFWFDARYLNGRDECDILVSADIEPEIIYVGNPHADAPDYRLSLPEGYTMDPAENMESCIRLDGAQVGGLSLTDISPEILAAYERDTFWDLLPEASELTYYADDTACSFAVLRYLTKAETEACFSEYMIMYWMDEDENPLVDVTFVVTNTETNERTETSNRFFVRGNAVYRLWFFRDMQPKGVSTRIPLE